MTRSVAVSMYTFAELENIAAEGGYTHAARDLSRITSAEVQQVHAGLVNTGNDEASFAIVALTKLRQWLMYGGNEPPPVRGAGFLRSDREVWIAYTTHPTPALVRGRPSAFGDLRRYMPIAASPHYDGSLMVRTEPPIQLLAAEDGIVLSSLLGSMRLSTETVSVVEHWLAATIQRKDRHGVLCLPDAWQA